MLTFLSSQSKSDNIRSGVRALLEENRTRAEVGVRDPRACTLPKLAVVRPTRASRQSTYVPNRTKIVSALNKFIFGRFCSSLWFVSMASGGVLSSILLVPGGR